ncbi:MAG: LLM class flavin-dependent oxidoreductase [Gammaproteobacteria bacterium]|nr:LLM class flavin-dependent oxidoreductase [Gammaproteobacteria bacterium]
MRFGMLHLFENPIGKTEHDIIHEQMQLMRAAEDLDFDSVWPAEHHFTEYGYCASPALSLAAIANETKRIRFGTGVVVLPLNHPLRIAEDFAFLDHLSNGRIDFGVGRGYQPLEFSRYGVDQTTTRAQFHEGMEVIRQAWADGRVNFKGEHFTFEDVPVRPKPMQNPIPTWMAALSAESFELVGRYGFNLLYGAVFGLSPENAMKRRVDYHRGLAAGGHSPDGKSAGCLMMVYVAETMEKARKEFREAVLWYYHTIAKYVAPDKGVQAVKGYEMYTDFRDLASEVDWETLVENDAVICGDPDYVGEKLRDYQQIYGFTEVLCWTRLGGLDHRKVLRSMELMRDKVIPHLRDAEPPPPPAIEPLEAAS